MMFELLTLEPRFSQFRKQGPGRPIVPKSQPWLKVGSGQSGKPAAKANG